MSRYGVAVYGRDTYGGPNEQAFTTPAFEARRTGYSALRLTWEKPGGTWDDLRIIRNYSGYPATYLPADEVFTELPVVVDHGQQTITSGATLSLPLPGGAPNVGDTLLAWFSIGLSGGTGAVGTPTGWTTVLTFGVTSATRMVVMKAVVGTGGVTASSSYNFNVSGGVFPHTGVIQRVVGSDGSVSASVIQPPPTRLTAPNVGDLALVGASQKNGTGNGNTTNQIAGAGWVTDENAAPTDHALVVGHAVGGAPEMVAAPALLGAASSTSEAALNVTVSGVTPGALIVVAVSFFSPSEIATVSFSASDTLGGLIWQKTEKLYLSGGNADTATFFYATAKTATAGTITVTPNRTGAASSGLRASAYQIVGASGVGTTGVSANDSGSVTLGAAPGADTMVLQMATMGLGSDPALTPPAGFTGLVNDAHTGTYTYTEVAYRKGGAAQTNVVGGSCAAAAAIEIVPGPVTEGTVAGETLCPTVNWGGTLANPIRALLTLRGVSVVPPSSGVEVYSAAPSDDVGFLMESDLQADRWVYYTMFVHDTVSGEWIRSGHAREYVPADYGGKERLLSVMPLTAQSDALNRMLSVLGFAYDGLRNDANSLLDLRNSDRVLYDLIPLALDQLGIPYETELEPEQYRRFLRNAVLLYQSKGTVTGIHEVVSALTTWPSVVQVDPTTRHVTIYVDTTDDPVALTRAAHMARLNDILPRYLPLDAVFSVVDGIPFGAVDSSGVVIAYTTTVYNFTGADATTLPAPWIEALGTWGISGNQAYVSATEGGGPRAVALIDTLYSDGSVTVERDHLIGPVFRYVDPNNFWFCDSAGWFKTVAGVATGAGWPGGARNTEPLRVDMAGSTLTFSYFNGTSWIPLTTVTDSFNLHATKHGLYGEGVTTSRADNFTFIAP